MDIEEFAKKGYLQEINRQFLHPLGLALAVRTGENGEPWALDSVYDCRSDPEGLYYDELTETDIDRALAIEAELDQRIDARFEKLGYVIQPLGRFEVC